MMEINGTRRSSVDLVAAIRSSSADLSTNAGRNVVKESSSSALSSSSSNPRVASLVTDAHKQWRSEHEAAKSCLAGLLVNKKPSARDDPNQDDDYDEDDDEEGTAQPKLASLVTGVHQQWQSDKKAIKSSLEELWVNKRPSSVQDKEDKSRPLENTRSSSTQNVANILKLLHPSKATTTSTTEDVDDIDDEISISSSESECDSDHKRSSSTARPRSSSKATNRSSKIPSSSSVGSSSQGSVPRRRNRSQDIPTSSRHAPTKTTTLRQSTSDSDESSPLKKRDNRRTRRGGSGRTLSGSGRTLSGSGRTLSGSGRTLSGSGRTLPHPDSSTGSPERLQITGRSQSGPSLKAMQLSATTSQSKGNQQFNRRTYAVPDRSKSSETNRLTKSLPLRSTSSSAISDTIAKIASTRASRTGSSSSAASPPFAAQYDGPSRVSKLSQSKSGTSLLSLQSNPVSMDSIKSSIGDAAAKARRPRKSQSRSGLSASPPPRSSRPRRAKSGSSLPFLASNPGSMDDSLSSSPASRQPPSWGNLPKKQGSNIQNSQLRQVLRQQVQRSEPLVWCMNDVKKSAEDKRLPEKDKRLVGQKKDKKSNPFEVTTSEMLSLEFRSKQGVVS